MNNNAIIGYTGFVGSNLMLQSDFEHRYNSKNINEIRGKEFETVVCSGISAQKWLANIKPEEDKRNIDDLIENLKYVKTKKFILISTIDVYNTPSEVDENTIINLDGLHPYGANRYYMENWVKGFFEDYLIVRLPALFGQGLKKNFIYDLINIIPSVIMCEKYSQIISNSDKTTVKIIEEAYTKDSKGNYNFNNSFSKEKREYLKKVFKEIGFTSMVFTDERSEFPYYFLGNLWHDIQIAIDNNIKVINIAVEPLSAKELAKECFNIDFHNIIQNKEPIHYDMRSIYSKLYNPFSNKYMYTKEETLKQIKQFLKEEGGANELSNF